MATIRRRGLKWQVQIRRKGVVPVSQSFHTHKDAEEWARYMEVQADRKDLPVDLGSVKRISLKDLVERYRDTVTINKRRCKIERYVLNRFLRHPICARSLAELRTADFAAYRDERLGEVKLASLKRELGPIRHMFGLARREWGLPLANNPLDNLLLAAKDQPRERRLRPGELNQLKQSMRLCRNPIIRPVVLFALETGMRRGEILNLTWDWVDLPNRALTVRAAKNGHSRTIPLTRAAVDILGSPPTTGGRVFPITTNAFRLAWERLRDRAGLADLRFHDLRHEAISCLFERGLSVPEVSLISGHRDPRMLFRYTHPLRQEILNKLDHCSREL